MPAVKSLALPLSAQRRAGILLGVGLLTALLAAFLFGHRRYTEVTPGNDAVFTSTRCVAALAAAPDGTVWVGTAGGVLGCRLEEGCRKFTRMDGLPSHEV